MDIHGYCLCRCFSPPLRPGKVCLLFECMKPVDSKSNWPAQLKPTRFWKIRGLGILVHRDESIFKRDIKKAYEDTKIFSIPPHKFPAEGKLLGKMVVRWKIFVLFYVFTVNLYYCRSVLNLYWSKSVLYLIICIRFYSKCWNNLFLVKYVMSMRWHFTGLHLTNGTTHILAMKIQRSCTTHSHFSTACGSQWALFCSKVVTSCPSKQNPQH